MVVLVIDLGLNSTPRSGWKYGPLENLVERFEVVGTMYNAVESQCDADPLVTAGMFRINPSRASEQKFVAMSRDLLKRWGGPFDYGDSIVVSGSDGKDGTYIVADAMNKRYKNRVDFLETSGTKWYKFNKIKIWKK